MFYGNSCYISIENKSQIYEAIDVIKFLRDKNSKLRIDFRGVSITHCNFTNFNLQGADLRDCEFTKCDFFGSDLTGIIIKNSIFDKSQCNSKTYISEGCLYFGEKFEPTKFPDNFNPKEYGMIDVIEAPHNKNVVEDIKEEVKEPS